MATLKIPVNEDDHIQGNADAPITLVEYGDYECPYCGIAHSIVKRIQTHLGDKLRFVFRNFPLNEIHPHAATAAIAAEFAGSKNKFWEMHDIIFENQKHLEVTDLANYAKSLNLPTQELKGAIEAQEFIDKIKNDFRGGVLSGVNGTPTFFINGNRHNAAFDYEELLAAIEKYL